MSRVPLFAAIALTLAAAAPPPQSFDAQRAKMVADIRAQVRAGSPQADDAEFERVLAIVARIHREDYVAPAARRYAYFPAPLQIGYGQTISDPYVVTLMTAALRLPANARVLDVGTGSGYQAAVLSPLSARVSSIEIVEPLAREAAQRLRKLGYTNIDVRAGDGFAGWPEHAPFDGIIVAAGGAAIPQPLLDQLKPGGRLVMPIGPSTVQEQLIVVTKAADGSFTRCTLGPTMFVPLTGKGERRAGTRGLIDRTVRSCYGAPIT